MGTTTGLVIILITVLIGALLELAVQVFIVRPASRASAPRRDERLVHRF